MAGHSRVQLSTLVSAGNRWPLKSASATKSMLRRPHLLKGAGERFTLRRLQVFLQNVLQHGLVQTQVGNQLFQFAVLFFELPESSEFGKAQSTVFFLPVEIRRLTDAHLSADLGEAGSFRSPLGGARRRSVLRCTWSFSWQNGLAGRDGFTGSLYFEMLLIAGMG